MRNTLWSTQQLIRRQEVLSHNFTPSIWMCKLVQIWKFDFKKSLNLLYQSAFFLRTLLTFHQNWRSDYFVEQPSLNVTYLLEEVKEFFYAILPKVIYLVRFPLILYRYIWIKILGFFVKLSLIFLFYVSTLWSWFGKWFRQ